MISSTRRRDPVPPSGKPEFLRAVLPQQVEQFVDAPEVFGFDRSRIGHRAERRDWPMEAPQPLTGCQVSGTGLTRPHRSCRGVDIISMSREEPHHLETHGSSMNRLTLRVQRRAVRSDCPPRVHAGASRLVELAARTQKWVARLAPKPIPILATPELPSGHSGLPIATFGRPARRRACSPTPSAA